MNEQKTAIINTQRAEMPPFGDLSTLVASVWQTDESGDLQTHLEESDRIIFGEVDDV